jgi:peptidoglycan/LPS O-acetylase OafA/YrhL
MKNNKIEILESLRGFCVLYVVLFHLLPQKFFFFRINLGLLFRFGSEAVIMFFILSGFVIKYSWEKSTDKSFKKYFTRRFLRIYIPLFFILLLAYAIKSYSEGGLADPDWGTLLGNIFMLQDIISLKPNVISAVYMGNGVLWSLSYEWWFYMIFIVLAKKIAPAKINLWVAMITIIATLSYLVYPFFLNRIVMYFAIWWIGVQFAEIYLKGGIYSFKTIAMQAYVLLTIIALLGINLYLNFGYTKVYAYPLVAYPIIELRNFVFAFLAMFAAIIWNNLNWFGFIKVFGIFKYLAPFSYVIYISHHYLVVEATYLNFLNHKIIENILYVLLMFLFSYLLEVVLYTKIKNILMSRLSKQSLNK